jgi:hypothetical protein
MVARSLMLQRCYSMWRMKMTVIVRGGESRKERGRRDHGTQKKTFGGNQRTVWTDVHVTLPGHSPATQRGPREGGAENGGDLDADAVFHWHVARFDGDLCSVSFLSPTPLLRRSSVARPQNSVCSL